MKKIPARLVPGSIDDDYHGSYRIVPSDSGLKVLSARNMKSKEIDAVFEAYNRETLDRLFLDHFCDYMDRRENNEETASVWTGFMESFGCVCVTKPKRFSRRHISVFDGDTEYVRVTHPYHPIFEDFWVPSDFASKVLVLGLPTRLH